MKPFFCFYDRLLTSIFNGRKYEHAHSWTHCSCARAQVRRISLDPTSSSVAQRLSYILQECRASRACFKKTVYTTHDTSSNRFVLICHVKVELKTECTLSSIVLLIRREICSMVIRGEQHTLPQQPIGSTPPYHYYPKLVIAINFIT